MALTAICSMFADERLCCKALGEPTKSLEPGNTKSYCCNHFNFGGHQEPEDNGHGRRNPVPDIASAK